MKQRKANAMPPLAFGQDQAVVHDKANQFGDLIEKAFPGLNAYDPLGDAKAFRSLTTVIQMATSQVVSTAVSPTVVERKSNPKLTFLLPFAGDPEGTCQVSNERLRWGLGRGGVFLPSCDERVIGTGGFRSQIMWQLERDRLLETARVMLGNAQDVDLNLDRFRMLPLEVAGVRTDASWQTLLSFFHVYRHNPAALTQLGVEDMLYRHSVMLLRPDLFEDSPHTSQTSLDSLTHRRVLDPLCEYIVAHLSEVWTLTDLGTVSGMSARSLQMAFNSRFGMSPMGWIKAVRLNRVRTHLLLAPGTAHIEAIALAAGFQTMPAFFKAYKECFGETPGQTRSRK